ncbi:hypothetical protein BV22DRAFT_994778, partial [Leucogyrophana mollusca]
KGFLKVFAAWIIDDDLPFTSGESKGLHRVFDYMKSRFLLPSDTTVRNQLVRIFAEMHGNIKDKIKMMFTFAGTIASWIDDDWNLIDRVIDFHSLSDKEHEGV